MIEKKNTVLCATGFTWRKNRRKADIVIGNVVSKTIHMVLSNMFGRHGHYSHLSTKLFIKKIKKFSPDIIHLHNIHGWYLNLPLFMKYIKGNDCSVVYTLHDCWPFTGGCAHFSFSGCERWKDKCGCCPNLKEYPIKSHRDQTADMLLFKKHYLSEINDLTIVTPSQWLADLAQQSFLGEYHIKVINNGIDLSIYKPTESDFKKKYHLEGKFVVLGVSLGWTDRKGLDVFIRLAHILPDNYRIVLVGTDQHIDSLLPSNVISIHRTHNQQELAKIYSAADLFVNPTREDNYPTVNMEALACGTPVITFRTGGSPEMLDETCGIVVDCDDVVNLEKEIIRICSTHPFSRNACVKKARSFDKNERFQEYVELYESIGSKRD